VYHTSPVWDGAGVLCCSVSIQAATGWTDWSPVWASGQPKWSSSSSKPVRFRVCCKTSAIEPQWAVWTLAPWKTVWRRAISTSSVEPAIFWYAFQLDVVCVFHMFSLQNWYCHVKMIQLSCVWCNLADVPPRPYGSPLVTPLDAVSAVPGKPHGDSSSYCPLSPFGDVDSGFRRLRCVT